MNRGRTSVRYDDIGRTYAIIRRQDPRIAAQIRSEQDFRGADDGIRTRDPHLGKVKSKPS